MSKKTPKNLKKVLDEDSTTLGEFTLEHMFDPSYDPMDHFSDPDLLKSTEYQVYSELSQLARDIAKDTLGYSHSSDVLDDAPESIFKDFAGKSPVVVVDDEDSSDYEEESESTESRHDQYDQVKDNFRNRLDESLGSGSYQKYDSFINLLKVAKEMGFGGTAQDFENILKNSSTFRSFAKDTTTAYTG